MATADPGKGRGNGVRLTERKFPRFLTVGFVGARRLDLPGEPENWEVGAERLRSRLDEVLAGLSARLAPGERLSAVSSLAAGGDTVFAEVVAQRSIWHQIYLPQAPGDFFNEKDFFGSAARAAHSRRLLDAPNVIEVRVASAALERRARFSEVGYQILADCDVLITVLRPDDAAGTGGTAETLAQARFISRPTIEFVLDGDLRPRGAASFALPPATEPAFQWSIETGDGAEAEIQLIAALKARASIAARRHKHRHHQSSGTVAVTNVSAAAIAAWSLAGLPHGLGTRSAKLVLLTLGIALYLLRRQRRHRRSWVQERLTAELCRSALAVRDLPGRLEYLTHLPLGDARELIRSLGLLHLGATRRMAQPASDLVDRYVRERLGGLAGARASGQIDYFEMKAAQAIRLRRCLQTAFYVLTAVALGTSAVDAWVGTDVAHATPWQRWICLFAPTIVPVLAAAAASWASTLDLDRRVDRYRGLALSLRAQRDLLPAIRGAALLAHAIQQIEQTLLLEVADWHGKQRHASDS